MPLCQHPPLSASPGLPGCTSLLHSSSSHPFSEASLSRKNLQKWEHHTELKGLGSEIVPGLGLVSTGLPVECKGSNISCQREVSH